MTALIRRWDVGRAYESGSTLERRDHTAATEMRDPLTNVCGTFTQDQRRRDAVAGLWNGV
jgi:hypothetical protein